MMSLLYASNSSAPPAMAAATAAATGAGASMSRLDDEINQTSFKVRKYIESKISILDPTSSAGAKNSTGGAAADHETKTEMGKLILDARNRAMYARQVQQQHQDRKEKGENASNDVEARKIGDLVAKMRETTTAEYCALKERAAALEKQKMALDAELSLCLQSLQVVGQAGSNIIDCDEWYASTIVPALDGMPPARVSMTSSSSSSLLQSRNDEEVSGRRSSFSSIPNFITGATNTGRMSHHHLNPFIDTIRRKEEEKRTLRCAEVIASLATKQQQKQHHIEGQWTEAEDAIIMKAVSESNAKPFTSWTALSEFLPGRTGKQIRERWFNSLDPNINKSPFTPEDDSLLWESHKQYGKKWVEIASKAFNGFRSANQVKNRWHSAKFKDIIQTKYGEGAYQRANTAAALKSTAVTDGVPTNKSYSRVPSFSSDISMSSQKRDLNDDDSTATPDLKKAKH